LQIIHNWEQGTSVQESLCRHLIRMAGETLEAEPERARHVTRQLEAQLDDLMARGALADAS
jgi:hypothetical protein